MHTVSCDTQQDTVNQIRDNPALARLIFRTTNQNYVKVQEVIGIKKIDEMDIKVGTIGSTELGRWREGKTSHVYLRFSLINQR